MTEEFRHAGIGIDLNIQGLDRLAELNRHIDSTLESFRNLGNLSSHVGERIGSMATNSSEKVGKLEESIVHTSTANVELMNKIDDVKNAISGIRTQNIENINKAFKNSSSSADNTMKAIENVRRVANNISSEKVDKLGSSTRKTGEDAKETTHHFGHLRDTMIGTFAGNVISNGISGIGSGLFDLTKQGLQFDAVSQDMTKHWREAGLSAGQSNAMVKQLTDIKQHADISAQSIMAMQKQYLVLTGNATQARELTSSVTAFGKESGMNDQQQSRVARLIASNRTINARTFNRTLGQAPAFANEIIKQTGMSKQAFYGLLQSGKITGQQLRDAMIKASKDSGKAWAGYAKTAQGKMDIVNATYSNVRRNFAKKLAGGIFDQLNKLANGKNLGKIQKQVEGIANSVGTIVGSAIGKVIGFLVKNRSTIVGVGKAVWNIVKGLASGVWSAFTGMFSIFTSNTGKASGGLKTIDKVLTGISKHQAMLKTIGRLIVAAFAAKKIYSFGHAIGTGINAIRGFAGAVKAASGAQDLLNVAMDANPFGLIAVTIAGVVFGLVEFYKRSKTFRKIVNGAFNSVKKTVTRWWKQAVKVFKAITRIIGRFAKYIKQHFGNVLRDQMREAKQVFKVIGDVFKVFKDIFTGDWKSLGKDVGKLAGDLWKLVKDVWKSGVDWVEDLGKDMWNAIWDTFKSWGKKIGNFFVDLWKGIKEKVADGINDVTGIINSGIKGLNWLLSKVGGSGHTIGLIPKVHLAQGTVDGKLPRTTMAMLNDGYDSPETHNREMAILPNGRAFMPKERNWTGILPKGTMVLNATQTRELMRMHGIEHYSLGSVASGVWNGIKHAGSAVWNGAKKVGNAIAHPIKFLKSMFGGLPKLPDYLTGLLGGMMNKAKDAVIDYFKKFGGGMNNPGGSGVQRWRSVAERAASFMGIKLSGSDMSALLARIAKESGGNPTITQKVSDVNSAAGHPAQGLFQYVPSTFASWAVKGFTNLLKGYDQFLAVFNDSNWRSDIRMPGGWGPTGHRARRMGGPVSKNHWYTVNEEGQELFKPNVDGQVINHNDSKKIMGNSTIKINAPLTVNVKGSTADKNFNKKLHDSYEEHTRALAEKLSQAFGMTDEGGYYPL